MAGIAAGWGQAGGTKARVLAMSMRMRAAGGGKGGKAAPAKSKKAKEVTPIGPTVDKEVRAKAVLGANILKEGKDPSILPDSDYPPWVFNMLDKPLALSELERRNHESMSLTELGRFVKLSNRRRIKDRNLLKAKS